MAKRQSFADKSSKKAHGMTCPVCSDIIMRIKYVKAFKADTGAWKLRAINTGVCKCNQAKIYG